MLRAGRWHECRSDSEGKTDEGSVKCEINGKRIRAKRPMRLASSLLRKKEADGKSASYVKRYIVYAVNPNRKS